jgi:putative phosphoribosyl transferase
MSFADRHDAGRQLALRLDHLRASFPLILGLAPGGVPVAAEIAALLSAPLDVFAVRPIRSARAPGVAIAVAAEDGLTLIDHEAVERFGVCVQEMDTLARPEHAQLARQLDGYRGGRAALSVVCRTVVLALDALPCEFGPRAALQALQIRGVRRAVLAVPVAALDAVEQVVGLADEVVSVESSPSFGAAREGYRSFREVGEEEIRALLATHTRPRRVVTLPAGVTSRDRDRMATSPGAT